MDDLTIKIILIVFGISYLIYLYFFDCRVIGDERRELVRLKSLRLTQKLNLGLLVIITVLNCSRDFSSLTVLGTLLIFNIICEVVLKTYFNRII
jgi:hypothetical protein